MTFREKLADWISGGALSRAIATRDKALDRYEAAANKRLETADKYAWAANRMIALRDTLEDIAAMETPSANATVRRMARTAREALE